MKDICIANQIRPYLGSSHSFDDATKLLLQTARLVRMTAVGERVENGMNAYACVCTAGCESVYVCYLKHLRL